MGIVIGTIIRWIGLNIAGLGVGWLVKDVVTPDPKPENHKRSLWLLIGIGAGLTGLAWLIFGRKSNSKRK